MEVKNGIIQYKNYNIPVMEIEDYVYNNDSLLLDSTMKDLSEIFIFGIPALKKNSSIFLHTVLIFS